MSFNTRLNKAKTNIAWWICKKFGHKHGPWKKKNYKMEERICLRCHRCETRKRVDY